MLEPDDAKLRSGAVLRGDGLLEHLAKRPPEERDGAVERLLGLAGASQGLTTLAPELIGYHASGVAPIVQALVDVPVSAEDVVIDLGAGLGKVALLAHLLTGARAVGIELQPDLAAHALSRAEALGLNGVSFVTADVRDAKLDDATVIYLYLPFTGAVLDAVMEKVEAVARRRTLVVCALGLDLHRFAWLEPRPSSSFWLSLYESRCPNAEPRSARAPAVSRALAELIASETALPEPANVPAPECVSEPETATAPDPDPEPVNPRPVPEPRARPRLRPSYSTTRRARCAPILVTSS